MISLSTSGTANLVRLIKVERYKSATLQKDIFSYSVFSEAKNTFSEKIPPQLGISLKELKEVRSILDKIFSYFKL